MSRSLGSGIFTIGDASGRRVSLPYDAGDVTIAPLRTKPGPSFTWREDPPGSPLVVDFTAVLPWDVITDHLIARPPPGWVSGGGNAHQRRKRRRAWTRGGL